MSRAPDKLTINARVYYSPIYFDGLSEKVLEAVQQFLKTLPFNGLIIRTRLKSAMMSVPGVLDVVLLETKGRKNEDASGSPGDTIFIRQYKTFGGCCLFDLASSNIEFLPD